MRSRSFVATVMIVVIAMSAGAALAGCDHQTRGGPGAAGGRGAAEERHGTSSPSVSPKHEVPSPSPSLPRGGRDLFPRWRVVAFYGTAGTSSLGVLGTAGPDQVWSRLANEAADFERPSHPVIPAYELITVVASSEPGPDGLYRRRLPAEQIDRYAEAARRHDAMLILDIQPGQGDFLTEAKRLAPWLAKPHVALALDPEWNMSDDEKPGQSIGSVSAAEINRVSRWLDDLTARHRLPEKLLLIHQFNAGMVENKNEVKQRKHLAITFNMDGFGAASTKKSQYRALASDKRFAFGFKLFYDEDQGLMSPRQVLKLDPPPRVIEYQ